MKFGPVSIETAVGSIVAHAVKREGIVLKKGEIVRAEHLEALRAARVQEIVVARLDHDDIAEDEAASRLAQRIAGDNLRVDRAFTGRANIFAGSAGILRIDVATVDAINEVDEALTLATLPPFRTVVADEMVATVKIIPFAVPQAMLAAALGAVVQGGALSVAPFRAQRVGIISTLLPGLETSVVDKSLRIMEGRLEPAGCKIAFDQRVPHDASLLAQTLRDMAPAVDILIVFGASAITDRRDVIPAALEAAGGRIEHFGMPVDPGNLLLLGDLAGKPVLGAPGCARSPKENGFDWVLHRILAGVPVNAADVRRMGTGGLLMEIVSRPQPRAGNAPGLISAEETAQQHEKEDEALLIPHE